MTSNKGYYRSEVEFDSVNVEKQRRKNEIDDDKIYTYEEALDLAGIGRYSRTLLLITSFTLLGMALEMYGFAVVVTACSCDFHLNQETKSIMMAIPFFGAMVMAFPWGYISDTQGRRKCFLFAMSGGFVASIISAFSINWIMMSICKFISASLCSQSITYAWIGESIPVRERGTYLLIFTSIGLLYLVICYTPAYFILNLNFSYNLGFINFSPWRLLALILALPLGISFIAIKTLLYESPKYLLKSGRDCEAVNTLRRICERNNKEDYPVNKITLSEVGNVESRGLPLLESFRVQTLPLFKPPYLWRTLQLFFLVIVVLGCTNSLFVWFPSMATAFYEGISANSEENPVQGLCNVIVSSQHNNDNVSLMHKRSRHQNAMDRIVQGLGFLIVNLVISKLSSRKKAVMIFILALAGASAIGTMLISDPYNISSFILFFGTLLNSMGIGIVYTYCVEIYPTSHRGMASSLVLLIGRISGLIAIYLIGTHILTHCSATFYTIAGLTFAASIMSCFLPPDKPKQKK